MSVLLGDILTLVGRLDDTPGVDTPRERFRRFILDLPDVAAVRALVEQAQRGLGEQQHRALQDAVVRLGRFLGFETTFGPYHAAAGTAKSDGQWRSRHRFAVVLDVRTNQTATSDIGDLSRSLVAMRHTNQTVPVVGLIVPTSTYGSRARLEEAVRAAAPESSVRVASVQSLLWLADTAQAGRLTHDEVVRLLCGNTSLDLVVDLLSRFAGGVQHQGAPTAHGPSHPEAPPVPAGPAYWVVTIGSDEAATPEQFVESVIRGRQVLGVREDTATQARVGDWLCFYVDRKGVVGQARIESVTEGAGLLRGSHRFRSAFRLKEVFIFESPIAAGPQTLMDQLCALTPTEDAGPLLASVSRQEFAELTAGSTDAGGEDVYRAG